MTELLAADSWLVQDGRARAAERHWARFAKTCAAHGVEDLSELRAAFTVPGTGRWFPRIELHADGRLAFQLRPAPPREPTVVAWIAGADPRRAPRHKGPDLGRLAALRERAAAHGAGEALITDDHDHLIEGAFTSLLWWEGETLCAVPDDAPILPGITRALLLELAGGRVALRRPGPQTLDRRETWLVSALHGIRVVTRWAGADLRPGDARHASEWQRALEDLMTPAAPDR